MNNNNLSYLDTHIAWKQRVNREMHSRSNFINKAFEF